MNFEASTRRMRELSRKPIYQLLSPNSVYTDPPPMHLLMYIGSYTHSHLPADDGQSIPGKPMRLSCLRRYGTREGKEAMWKNMRSS